MFIYWCSHMVSRFWLLIPCWPPFAVGMSRFHSLSFSWVLELQQSLICSSMSWDPSCLCLQSSRLVLHKLYPQLFYCVFMSSSSVFPKKEARLHFFFLFQFFKIYALQKFSVEGSSSQIFGTKRLFWLDLLKLPTFRFFSSWQLLSQKINSQFFFFLINSHLAYESFSSLIYLLST